jgi:NitT/TauT family transport system substrate-binding protein
VYLDERNLWPNGEFATTHLVTTKRYLDGHQDILRRFLTAFVDLTIELQHASSTDLATMNGAITNFTTVRLSQETLDEAFAHLNVTYDPIASSLSTYLEWAQDPRLGFIPAGVDPKPLYDLNLLNEILAGKGLPPVNGL